MWLTSATEDVYTIRGVPVFLWSAGGAFSGFGTFFVLDSAGWFLRSAKPAEQPGDTILTVLALLFIPLVGLGLLAFAPLIVTRLDRKNKAIAYSKYGILGISNKQIPYEHLDGGVHIQQDESEEGGFLYSAYFELKDGTRMKMCAEPGQWQGRNYSVAMRANEFLRRRDLAAANAEIITLDLS